MKNQDQALETKSNTTNTMLGILEAIEEVT
jgi:hypothetical protein